mgnify:FL=1
MKHIWSHTCDQHTFAYFVSLDGQGNLRAAFAQNARILDVGCGPGNLTGFIAKHYPDLQLSVTGVDCSEKMLDEARKLYPGKTD